MFVGQDDFLKIKMPNTVFFGLIPAGQTKDNSPLANVSNVYTSRSYKLLNIIIGLLLVIFGFSSFGSDAGTAIILLVIGVLLMGSGIKTVFAYERSGVEKRIELPFFEANHAEEFEEEVVSRIAAFQDDRNVRKHSESNAQTITDAIRESHKD